MTAMEIQRSKERDGELLAKVLALLTDGDKREVLGYAKCLYASRQDSATGNAATVRPSA